MLALDTIFHWKDIECSEEELDILDCVVLLEDVFYCQTAKQIFLGDVALAFEIDAAIRFLR